MSTITNSGEDIIHARNDISPHDISDDNGDNDGYEIKRTARDILEHGYSRIALQFPDELLHHSVGVYRDLVRELAELRRLNPGIAHSVYILADTTYNACCVDEVAAQHVDADVIVHYGHACLEPSARLPVIYVLGKRRLDVGVCVDAVAQSILQRYTNTHSRALLVSDTAYAWKAPAVCDGLNRRLKDTTVHLHNRPPSIVYPALNSGAPPPVRPADESKMQDHEADGSALKGEEAACGEDCGCSDTKNSCTLSNSCNSCTSTNPRNPSIAQRPVSTTTLPTDAPLPPRTLLIYIGGASLKLTNLVLTHAGVAVLAYDPTTHNVSDATGSENRLLQRRYAQASKARDCDVFGLAVGTLSTASYLPLVRALRAKLQAHRKKVYTVAVGKLNPAKLGNFGEIQAWCVVACKESSIVNSKEFITPVVTPFELEMALDGRTWTGEYVLDFPALLDPSSRWNLSGSGEAEQEQNHLVHHDPDAPTFSASSGRLVHHRRFDDGVSSDASAQVQRQLEEGADALTLRTKENALQVMHNSAAAAFLHNERSWKGLEVREGQDAPSQLETGRAGVARGYTLPTSLSASESVEKAEKKKF
ncbi:hypothetical protein E3P77_02556 [Wallemia ichthyophaga]|nr:hypothetical protein E3P77_02556 [Wallemia ichthyophaga]